MDKLNKFFKNISGFQYYFILSALLLFQTWIFILPSTLIKVCVLILSFFRFKKLKFSKNQIIVFFIVTALMIIIPVDFSIINDKAISLKKSLISGGLLYTMFVVLQLIFKNSIKIKTREIFFNIILFTVMVFLLSGVLNILMASLQLNIYGYESVFSGRSLIPSTAMIISTYLVYFLKTLINRTSLYKRFISKETTNHKEHYKTKEIIKKPIAQNHSKYVPKAKKQNIGLDDSKEVFQTFKNENHSNYIPTHQNEEIIPKRLNFKDFKSVGFVNFYNGSPYTGIGFELNKAGNIQNEFNLINGIKDGKAVEFYENGEVKIESHYNNDKLNGLSTTFLKNGEVKSKASFDNGKLIDLRKGRELINDPVSDSKISKEDAKNKLIELKEYLDLGIITQDEFDEKAKPLKKILLSN
jgi:antitoxin component YwqK of YwqJK toxin-antitoxin module